MWPCNIDLAALLRLSVAYVQIVSRLLRCIPPDFGYQHFAVISLNRKALPTLSKIQIARCAHFALLTKFFSKWAGQAPVEAVIALG